MGVAFKKKERLGCMYWYVLNNEMFIVLQCFSP